MKKEILKPKFDKEGYQTNLKDLNGEPLPNLKSLRILTREEEAMLGLPTPEELAAKPIKTRKITLAVDDDALDYFKQEARRLGTSYQRMMRNLLSSYAHTPRG